MVETPDDRKYAKTHEWARVVGDAVVVGISDYAQDALTDVVYIELPKVGDTVEAGQSFGVVESVKSVSDLYAPVSGTIVEVNEGLLDAPEKINDDAYGDGWMVKIAATHPELPAELMDASAYIASVGEDG